MGYCRKHWMRTTTIQTNYFYNHKTQTHKYWDNKIWNIGLKYEDLLNNEQLYIKEALELSDPEYYYGRLRRLKRASDLTLKGKNYTDYAPSGTTYEPYVFELRSEIEKLKERDEEEALLNLHKK